MMEPVNSSSLGAMGSLLRKLDELLHSEDRAQGLIGDLRIISTKMEKLSEVHSLPHTVKYWMNDARELSYDMEVCVDLFVHASQPEDLPAKVAWVLAWIKEILGYEARVKEVNGRCESYNLVNKYVLSTPAKILLSHHLRSLYEEPNPVGMEQPTNKILEWMMPKSHTEEHPKLKVISVLGDEGVGKSTLVKRVWQESLQDKFEFKCRAFVQTAKKPDTRMILRSILSQVHPKQPINASKVTKLIDDLREHLQDKRYFIVIDGLWDVSIWHIIKRAFPAGNQRIVTTTSVEKVAHVCCSYDSNSIVNVKCLCGEEAKTLFVDRAFGSEKGCPPQFNDAMDEIIRKCGGLPLAIICMARIVASQPETKQERQLDYVNKFLANNLRAHSSSLEILNQVLKLCYSSLPHCLKTCLLYLSVYPENYLFLKEDIVKKWIAEDFICTPEGKDIVEVAGSYFDELLSLGLIQRMGIVKSDKKGLLSYTVHPVVFDFITSKSMEDNFVTIMDYSQLPVDLTEMVRRLSLHFGSATYATTPESVKLSQIRTVCFIGLLGCMPSVAEFKLVRVMILHIFSEDLDTRFSLAEICKLLQLRYVQVRCNVTVELPKEMQCLKHLETLEINAGVEYVPSDIVLLSRLRHVGLGEKTKRTSGQGGGEAISSLDWSRLPSPSCISLESFELLRPICIFSRLPQWFLQMHKLRILEIVVRKLLDDINVLAELPVLKSLSLYVQTPPTEAIILGTGMFPALEYFKFVCGVLSLGFHDESLPHLRKLKLVFNAHKGEQYSNMLVGIEHLLKLQNVAGSIGLAPGAEESDRTAAESAFNNAIREHPCHRSFEEVVKRVDQVDEDWNQQEGSSNERGHNPPVLGDPVWRLKMIAKEGTYHRKLKSNNIETVQEFLRMLTVNPEELRAILDSMPKTTWEAVTTHAKTCDPGDKVYAYTSAGCTIHVNSVFNLVKVEIGGTVCTLQQLNGDQTMLVRQLILQAYEKRYNLIELEKRCPPSLGDSVRVLGNIAKEGLFHDGDPVDLDEAPSSLEDEQAAAIEDEQAATIEDELVVGPSNITFQVHTPNLFEKNKVGSSRGCEEVCKLQPSNGTDSEQISNATYKKDADQVGDYRTDWLIREIGRDLSICCLLRLSRSYYCDVACVNRSFRTVVRSGDLYRSRRQNGIVEHMIYVSCNVLEWEGFDLCRQRWFRIPSMPPNECFMVSDKESLAVGTNILVFGGYDKVRVVLRYSLLTNSWTTGEMMNTPRCLFGSASFGEKAIVAGGFGQNGALSSAELYDSEMQTWTILPNMHRARQMCSGFFMDGKFYVIGGKAQNDVLSCAEEFDLENNTWRLIPDMAQGLNGGSGAPPLVAVVNNQLYAADYASKEVKKYDKNNNAWITLGLLPVKYIFGHGWGIVFCSCGDMLIVIGATSAGGGSVRMIEICSWVPNNGPPDWKIISRRPSGNCSYSCAVMSC